MTKTPIFARKLQTLCGLFRSFLAQEPRSVISTALKGHISPMPENCKRETLLYYAKKFGPRVFIETGTFRGETLAFLEKDFNRLVSLELSREFFLAARKKFENHPKIELLFGDSADLLQGVLASVDEKALIWLDAHYSGKDTALGPQETPIIKELDMVFSQSRARHVILIDDAREFGGNPNYPPLSYVEEMASKSGWHYECRFDLIRLTPI